MRRIEIHQYACKHGMHPVAQAAPMVSLSGYAGQPSPNVRQWTSAVPIELFDMSRYMELISIRQGQYVFDHRALRGKPLLGLLLMHHSFAA